MKNGKKLILLVAVALTACGCQKAIFESQLKAYVVRSGTDKVELNTLVFTDCRFQLSSVCAGGGH